MKCPFVLIAVLALGPLALGDARIETSDAHTVTGEILTISAKQIAVQTKSGRQTLPVGEAEEIVLAAAQDPMAETGRGVLVMASGDVLTVTDLTGEGGRLRLDSPLLGQVDVPLEAARLVYLPGASRSAQDVEARYREMTLPEPTSDRIVVARKDKPFLPVDGVLEAIGAETVTVQWKGESRDIARKNVLMIRLAALSPTTQPAAASLLTGRDGSKLTFTSLTLDKGTFTVAAAALGQRKVPLDRVAAIHFASGHVVKLSDLQPAAVQEFGFFDTTFHYRVNRSAAGKPIRLGGREFATGLGLHSFCELTYELDGKYRTFVATVGIDEAVRPNGDAALTFLADGKELGGPLRLTGKTDPQPVRLKLDGVRSFTIRVDFGGDGLDLSDHVNLAGARLIK